MDKENEGTKEKKEEKEFIRKAKKIGEIAGESVITQLEDPLTYMTTLGVVFADGLIRGFELKRGLKVGFGVAASVVGSGIVYNIFNHDL